MTLRNLRVFVTVCQHMNMSRAARILFLSPPAVSQIIRELENYFGTPLFLRQGHQLYLTHAGTTLYHAALPLLKGADQLEEIMRREAANSTLPRNPMPPVFRNSQQPLLPGSASARPAPGSLRWRQTDGTCRR